MNRGFVGANNASHYAAKSLLMRSSLKHRKSRYEGPARVAQGNNLLREMEQNRGTIRYFAQVTLLHD
jgi:hypothetical protein